jgi:flagellin-like hook-associated protein FlgL
MVARSQLTQNMSALQTSLERLSTGFRINSGKDDPAGLIASEILRSDMTGINMAIRNTERANMMIATADSALNQVTNLLNTIRGLVTEAANTGVMSAEMIAANQLQTNASLDAIDRIAAQTTFMGKKLLDGSLDFNMVGQDRTNLQDLAVHQVTFGAEKAPVTVNFNVRGAAEKAALYYNNPVLAESIMLSWGGNYGYTTLPFEKGATVAEIAQAVNATSDTTGVIAEVGSNAINGTLYTSSLGYDNDIIITAGTAGSSGGNLEVKYLKGSSTGVQIKYVEPPDGNSAAKLQVYLQTEAYKASVADDIDNTVDANGNSIHDNNALKFTANIEGAQYNDTDIHYVDGQLTDPRFGDAAANPTENANYPYAYYSSDAAKSAALFGNVNGLTSITSLQSLGPGNYFSIQSKAGGTEYNNVEMEFVAVTTAGDNTNIPAGKNAAAAYVVATDQYGNVTGKKLQIFFRDDGTNQATIQDVQDALKIERHEGADGKIVAGAFELVASNANVLTQTLAAADAGARSNTNNSGGKAGTLFIVLPPQTTNTASADYGKIANPAYTAGPYDPNDVTTHEFIDANTIKALFNLDNQASKGSEQAAALFTVESTADNSGTGLMHLYNYNVDANGDPDAAGTATRIVKTAFDKAFKDGVTGGDVITTAAELVTALNNSAYWGLTLTHDMLAELSLENVNGLYYDATNPPPLTAALAPGQHGLFAVSAFEEVAYYGDPNDGTALQFLGEKNSPSIRFVAEAGNSSIWIDRTTVPDVVGNAQAVLTAQDSGASLTITAVKTGGNYDDVQFVFKRISEDDAALLGIDRKDGWVEYDPGTSFAEAQMTFKDAAGVSVPNSAFTLKADERGDQYNNVSVVMRSEPSMVDNEDGIDDGIIVQFDSKTNQVRVSIDSSKIPGATTQEIIAAINNAKIGFTAELSYAEDPQNDGSGIFGGTGGLPLPEQGLTVGNTGETGGHLGGTVTVWLADEENDGIYAAPTQEDIVRLINADAVVGKLFTAKAYNTVAGGDSKVIDFVKDGPVVTSGGLISKGAITVHLATDANGLVLTTAKDLAAWWEQQDPATVDNISLSIVRPVGAQWDECNDPYGNGLLKPTISIGDCDQLVVDDIQFVGWNDKLDYEYFMAERAKGTMTSQRGIDSSYELVAKQYGAEWNGYTIQYINDDSLTGYFADNFVEGSDKSPYDADGNYVGFERDDCGNLITPSSSTEKGLRMEYDEAAKKIVIYVRFGATTANDIEQLIESDERTRTKFEVNQLGTGTGLINAEDDTLLTKDGALPPGGLNGAKLLFGADATDYRLIFRSLEYGSDQFVNVLATAKDGGNTTFSLYDTSGNIVEKSYGKDVDLLINGIKAIGSGLDAALATSTLALDAVLSEQAATTVGWSSSFTITGGGATYQIGPDVVSKQQITLGIQSVDTIHLGGASGKLFQLYTGGDADLSTDTNKAFRIIEESLLAVTQIRGRLGTVQKATFDTNITVLQDTLSAITEAESQIRDADFAEETSNLTRAQILVQANMNTLSIANQIPNYMLSLLGG